MFRRISGGLGRRTPPRADPEAFPTAAYASGLKARMAALPDWQQAALAAACAERLYPAYAAFRDVSGTDEGGLVRRALDLAWEGATAGSISEADPAALFERCVALIPDQEADFTIPDHADDGIAAAAYALQAAAGLSGEAAGWAATRGTDALDAFLINSGAVAWTATTRAERAQMDQRVWEHGLVRAEVARREADLACLATGDRAGSVREIRARATGDSLLPLDQLDHEVVANPDE